MRSGNHNEVRVSFSFLRSERELVGGEKENCGLKTIAEILNTWIFTAIHVIK